MSDIRIPANLWEDDKEGVIVTWLYDDGDTVEEGAYIAEIMVEKSQFEITAPATGILSIGKQAEETIKQGEVIGKIG